MVAPYFPPNQAGDLTMDAPLIEAKGLHKLYSGVHALNNVDFQVFRG